MKPSELREMTIKELMEKERELKENLMRIRFDLHFAKSTDTSVIRKIKRDIARIKTIITEKQRKGEMVNAKKEEG